MKKTLVRSVFLLYKGPTMTQETNQIDGTFETHDRYGTPLPKVGEICPVEIDENVFQMGQVLMLQEDISRFGQRVLNVLFLLDDGDEFFAQGHCVLRSI